MAALAEMDGVSAPVVYPGETPASVTDTVCDVVLKRPTSTAWWIAFGLSGVFLLILIVSAMKLFISGVGTWGVNIPVAWGFALANYVWWIGIASGGTIISALFYLMSVDWRTATNRLAESMMLWAAACAGLMPIFHLGRQGLFYWLFPYPNAMDIWPQFRSPLLWDFFALLCYILASILFWYLGAIPDFASMRDLARTRRSHLFYGILSVGWRGSASEWKRYRVVYGILAGLLAPMVVSVHSVVGLDFAGGLTPGWHSTMFPPYFVFGAVFSGFATVIFLMIPVRWLYHLEAYITPRHFNVMSKLMLVCGLLLTYAYVFEAFGPYYGGDPFDLHTTANLFSGIYAWGYWGKLILNVVVPQLLWFPAIRTRLIPLMFICLGIIIGMWLERFEIVINSLYQDFLPSAWYHFVPTIWDWGILLGSVGLFITGFLVMLRFVPIISLAEMRELAARQGSTS